MTLRPYQQDAFEAARDWYARCLDPCLIEAATGAGKSHIVAAIAHDIHARWKKKVLCLAPSQELVMQNHAKYIATGNKASIYCASISKSLAHDIVFGSPTTVLNAIERFRYGYGAVVIDEAHGVTPTVKSIVEKLKEFEPRLRVIGLTATPYRTGEGYIYRHDDEGKALDEDVAKCPYFHTLVSRITAHELIAQGFLTPPHADPDHIEGYDTSALQGNKFDEKEVERTFEGKGRKTSAIIYDIVAKSRDRKGVIIFAATVKHAYECLDSLPEGISAIVHGGLTKQERKSAIEGFLSQRIKYIVNVGVLTTGFDATHVDVVALMRKTESVGLLQQMVGRGLRLHPGKSDCLILDYAENIEKHCPDGDIFNPRIKAVYSASEAPKLEAVCEQCDTVNVFSARKNDEGFEVDRHGYFIDLEGHRIPTENGPMPAHFGRRCFGEMLMAHGEHDRCNYRWTFKACPACEAENDIAARYCSKCKEEIVDPNEKLVLEYAKMKKDVSVATVDKVLSWMPQKWVTRSGNEVLRVDYITECRKFSVWYNPESRSIQGQKEWSDLSQAVFRGRIAPDVDSFMSYIKFGSMPETITAYKPKGSDFYKVVAHNEIPTVVESVREQGFQRQVSAGERRADHVF